MSDVTEAVGAKCGLWWGSCEKRPEAASLDEVERADGGYDSPAAFPLGYRFHKAPERTLGRATAAGVERVDQQERRIRPVPRGEYLRQVVVQPERARESLQRLHGEPVDRHLDDVVAQPPQRPTQGAQHGALSRSRLPNEQQVSPERGGVDGGLAVTGDTDRHACLGLHGLGRAKGLLRKCRV